MSSNEIISTVTELQELRRMQEELSAEIEALQDKIKAHMSALDVEQFTAGAFKVSWKPVTSSRLDTTKLKKDVPEIAQRYMKTTTTRPLLVR